MDHLCHLCIVFAMLSPLFIVVLWSLAGEELTIWLSFCDIWLFYVTFPRGILGQVWYFIVPIPDLCNFSNFSDVLA